MASSSPLIRRGYSLSLKIHEAKELAGDPSHGCDPYVSVLVDQKEEWKTKTVWNTRDPAWDQDYFFDLQQDFSFLCLVIWDENRRVKDIPLGKVTLSKDFLVNKTGAVEQWMQLAAAETEGTVTGDLHLNVSYYRPTAEVPKHTFSVNVLEARNLIPKDSRGYSDPYVILHVLPDPEAESTRQTRVVTKSVNPEYLENFTFAFDLDTNIEELVLHVSVWDWDRFADHHFMGHLTVPFLDVLETENVVKWYPLLPAPVAIRVNDGKLMSKIKPMIRRHSRKGSFNAITSSKSPAVGDPTKGKAFVKAFQALPSDHSTRIDRPRGSLRIFYNFTEEKILSEDRYRDFLAVISEDSYALSNLLGRFTQNRDDAARALIKIFQYQGKAKEFLCGVIEQEILATADTNTLFRGNSIASKSLDVYMKLTALPYIQLTLGSLIEEMLTSRRPCELDPTRVEKQEDIEKHLKDLIHFCDVAFQAIVNNADQCPQDLREIFRFIRRCVKLRFPTNEVVEYTAVSGFIFLRFFCPAIMGPSLFGLWDEHIEKSESRSLTLVAKTLQSLGNLVDFGHKEAYMKGLNPFIVQRFGDLKAFIEKISVVNPKKEKEQSRFSKEDFDLAKNCARLKQHFEDCKDQIVKNANDLERPIADKLVLILERMNAELKAEEDKIIRKREHDRASRRSVAAALANSDGKVTIKPVPQPNTLSDLDDLLEDLENFDFAKVKPKTNPDHYRPPTTFSTNEEAFEAIERGIPSRPADHPRSRSANKSPLFGKLSPLSSPPSSRPSSAFLSSPQTPSPTSSHSDSDVRVSVRSQPVGMKVESGQIKASPHLPTARIVPVPASVPSPKTTEKSALDSLDDLLNDLNFAVSGSDFGADPSPPSKVAEKEVSLEEILAQAAAAAQRFSQTANALSNSAPPQAFQKQTVEAPKPPEPVEPEPLPKDDMTALDDLLEGFDNAAATAILQNESTTCVYCSQEIREQNCHTWAGFKWHSNHFKCSVCKIDLEGSKFFFHDDQLFCVDDFQSVFSCAACGLHIADHMSEALGRKYHANCFCCSVCDQPLTNNFRIDDEGNLFCKNDWLKKNASLCAGCNKPIMSESLSIGQLKYHPNCLKCAECGEGLAGKEFVTSNDKYYCAMHFRCGACNGFLDSQIVCALGKKYHVGHFSCFNCKTSLVGAPFYERSGSPWCGSCYNR